MPRGAVCGGEYAKTMEIRLNDAISTYDCFECAIHAPVPAGEHCGCRVIGRTLRQTLVRVRCSRKQVSSGVTAGKS